MDDAGYSARMPPIQHLSVMMNQLTQMHPDIFVHRAQNQDDVPEAPATHDLEPPPLRKPTVRPGLFVPSICLNLVTPMELVIIKLTAQFAIRYGMLFCRALMKKVVNKPQFQLFKLWWQLIEGSMFIMMLLLMRIPKY
ncbi:unnamed protein product [Arabis nemorensis]|uniref:SURP motif domain-containing protein n=1 Tax=Arabis nemorensis TaxID=586526 RepID=A0A565CMC7_9BRAS|nr:unnamed protein product [Arabis nemorensis]